MPFEVYFVVYVINITSTRKWTNQILKSEVCDLYTQFVCYERKMEINPQMILKTGILNLGRMTFLWNRYEKWHLQQLTITPFYLIATIITGPSIDGDAAIAALAAAAVAINAVNWAVTWRSLQRLHYM